MQRSIFPFCFVSLFLFLLLFLFPDSEKMKISAFSRFFVRVCVIIILAYYSTLKNGVKTRFSLNIILYIII